MTEEAQLPKIARTSNFADRKRARELSGEPIRRRRPLVTRVDQGPVTLPMRIPVAQRTEDPRTVTVERGLGTPDVTIANPDQEGDTDGPAST